MSASARRPNPLIIHRTREDLLGELGDLAEMTKDCAGREQMGCCCHDHLWERLGQVRFMLTGSRDGDPEDIGEDST